jgi:UV DNA damage endonuclease
MGLDREHKVIIHGGALYGDREGSTRRLMEKLPTLPERWRRRIILENDERYFSLAQILEIAEAVGLPVCFDLHHHQINPGEGDLRELLERVARTWDCVPKLHMSSQKPNARVGAHDDLLHERDMRTLAEVLPFESDVMVESKGKEVAAHHAWQWWSAQGCLAADAPR